MRGQSRYLKNPLFPEKLIKSRYADLYYSAKGFLKDWNKGSHISHDIDGSALYAVIVSAMHDVARYKLYHFKDPAKQRLDAVKRAAYYTKWIVRMRPIYAIRKGTIAQKYDEDDTTLFVNEAFALVTSFNHLRADPRCKIKYRIRPELWSSLIYDLKYRAMTEDALIAVYQMIFDDSRGIRPTSS